MKQRQEWFGAQLDLDPRKLVFIDETGASTNLARKGGRCRQGRRLRVGIPHGHYKTVTLVAGLRLSGLVAQKAFDKPMNAATFEEWVEKCLVPTLSKGDIVVIDNLSSHKGPRVEQLIEAAGAEMRYLPPTMRRGDNPRLNFAKPSMAKDPQHYWRAEGVIHPLNLSDLRCMSSLRLGLPPKR